jgi:hypothetical protein
MIQWRRPFYAVSEAVNVERTEIVHHWSTVARKRMSWQLPEARFD